MTKIISQDSSSVMNDVENNKVTDNQKNKTLSPQDQLIKSLWLTNEKAHSTMQLIEPEVKYTGYEDEIEAVVFYLSGIVLKENTHNLGIHVNASKELAFYASTVYSVDKEYTGANYQYTTVINNTVVNICNSALRLKSISVKVSTS